MITSRPYYLLNFSNRFRLVFCQLEVLRHCPPSNIRRTLKELPKSIEKTYERILKDIKEPNRDHAHRIFQCLVVAVRPLRVEELAEVLAVDFDDPGGIAKLKPSWRRDDEERALLSSCSSLITIVTSDNSRVVQFSHFSAKQFLTSPRLTASSGDLSHYHVALNPAHTTLGRACLAVLLRSGDPLENGIRKNSPLAGYAAQHWVTHAQFEDVSSSLRKPMEYLFDLDNPYFAAWLKLHDVDVRPGPGSTFFMFGPYHKSDASPLYYTPLRGFHDLAEHLIDKYPQQVNAHGGYLVTPLVAALVQEHFKLAELLLRHGAATTANARENKRIPLQSAAFYGQIDVVRFLLNHNADVNSRDDHGWTALHCVGHSRQGSRQLEKVTRLLLERGADLNARNHTGNTPLLKAVDSGNVTVARVLLEHRANVDAEDKEGRTPFQLALGHEQK